MFGVNNAVVRRTYVIGSLVEGSRLFRKEYCVFSLIGWNTCIPKVISYARGLSERCLGGFFFSTILQHHCSFVAEEIQVW